MKTDLFHSCGHCWVLQICWHIECSTFIASSFRIWNSSTGIPSPLLILFRVMLPKAHLTSHWRMSGSRWVITPSWWVITPLFFTTSLILSNHTHVATVHCTGQATSDLNYENQAQWKRLQNVWKDNSGYLGAHFFFFFILLLYFYIFFYWSAVDLQCCVSFRCTEKWFILHMCVCGVCVFHFRFFSIICYYKILNRVPYVILLYSIANYIQQHLAYLFYI